jgi:hypothetical protein
MSTRANRVLGRNLKPVGGTTAMATERSPSNTRGTYVVAAMIITKGTTLVLKGLVQRRSEAPCATLISHDTFKRRTTSPGTTAKPILVSS